jgi:hypothetical protein
MLYIYYIIIIIIIIIWMSLEDSMYSTELGE